MRHTKYDIQNTKNERRVTAQHASRRSDELRMNAGSALILAVVLTSLLAIIGVMFLMVARVDKISTSAISENKELNLAVDTVIAEISQQLVLDTPGAVDPNQEYYDYPDVNNAWLASLEPDVNSGGGYYWRHISDIYEKFGPRPGLLAKIIPDYQLPPEVNEGLPADADGDGVSDSVWVMLNDMTSNKGKPIFAAIRVIDNGGMLNINTAYKFDPNEGRSRIDGSSQTQINLAALSQRGANGTLAVAAVKLQDERCGTELNDLSPYEWNVVWRYDRPNGKYTPFDISDELKLRNRYILNYNKITTRIEEFWANAYDVGLEMPRTKNPELTDPNGWFWKANNSSWDVNEYDYRHISTIYNMDRIIRPDGRKMVNVNKINPVVDPNVGDLYRAIRAGLGDAGVIDDSLAAQMAVNLKDFRDNDANIATISMAGSTYYGFEQPCIFISELVYRFKPDVNDPNIIYSSYAIELRKRYSHSNSDTWQLIISGIDPIPITDFGKDAKRYNVIVFEDTNVPLAELVDFNDSPENGETGVDPDVVLRWPVLPGADANYSYDVYFGTDFNDVRDANTTSPEFIITKPYNDPSYDPYGPPPGALNTNTTYYWRIDDVYDGNVIGTSGAWEFTTWVTEPNSYVYDINYTDIIFDANSKISLIRSFDGNDLMVDSVIVPPWLVSSADPNGAIHSFQRDITPNRWIKRLWDRDPILNSLREETLGHRNTYSNPNTDPIQVRFGRFNNVGEIGQVFRRDVYNLPWDENTTEANVRIDLENLYYQQLFKYLTVMDPAEYTPDPNETRIKGRININTAPWYVIAQLPWVSQKKNQPINYELAQAIVTYRDNTVAGFRSIGELNNVVSDPNSLGNIDYYWRDGIDQLSFPDLTHGGKRSLGDEAANDFEERDLIFSRISDLVTVRSDVFTAYILVRIGANGPQKRVIAILDRSDVYPNGPGGIIGNVKVRALHPVPDPR